MDYSVLNSDGEPEDNPKMLVLHADSNKGLWALWVNRNGPSIEVVNWVWEQLEEACHSGEHIALKSD